MTNLITKEEKDKIDLICKEYNIKKYTINSDGAIDVAGDVTLTNKHLFELPLRFNKVSGSFYCMFNELSNLKGSPSIVGGNYDVSCNRLTSLQGMPNVIAGDFQCYENDLSTLLGGPIQVDGDVDCGDNFFESLTGLPGKVGGCFRCYNNKLLSTYSGDVDIEITGDFNINPATLPVLIHNNLIHIKLIMKYQRHFMIWNDDLTLNEENFNELIVDIKDGLE